MKKRVRVLSRFFGLRKRNEHIRHLFIVGMSFAGRGGDRISAAGVCFDYRRGFLEMFGIRQGTAAEFDCF